MPVRGLVTIVLAAGLALAAFPGAGAGPSPDPDPAVVWADHLRRCLAGVHSLSARVTEELLHPLGVRGQTRTGRLELRRGGRLRLDYDLPAGGSVVSDGKVVRSFDPASRLFVEQAVHQTPLALILDFAFPDGSGNGLSVEFLGGATTPARGSAPAVVALVPRQERSPLGRVALVLEPACPCVRRVVVDSGSGALVRLSFEDVRVNPGIGRRRFVLEPPPGVAVVRP